MNYFFFCIQLIINNYQKIVEKDFIYYNIIAIKWGESTHFPGRNDPDSSQLHCSEKCPMIPVGLKSVTFVIVRVKKVLLRYNR